MAVSHSLVDPEARRDLDEQIANMLERLRNTRSLFRSLEVVAEGNLLSEDDQWAKLKLVGDTARQVWG